MGSCCGVEENQKEVDEVCVEPLHVEPPAKTVGALNHMPVYQHALWAAYGHTRAIPGPAHVATRQMPNCIRQRQTTAVAPSAVRGSRLDRDTELAELVAKSEALFERVKAGEAMLGKAEEWLKSQGDNDRLNDPLFQVDHKFIELQRAAETYRDLRQKADVGLRIFKC
mmetsp:Transcript_1570/g.2758  ORF Transcript_1570/g.2758 Transcript_1570/m.2758 type:complete len:168 (+) Transcript_1570:39-542(+)